jgi:hypothetical protein
LFSVTQNAVGTAALSYSSSTGVFSYTPPDLSSYLTAEADTLATVTGRGATTSTQIISSGGFGVGQSNGSGNLTLTQDGTQNSVISHLGTGSLTLKTNNSNGILIWADDSGGDIILRRGTGAGVVNRLSTTSTGVTVTGALTAGGLTYPTTNGNSGDVLTSNGSGSVTWTAPTGLQSRATAQVTTSIANGGTANISLTTPKTYALLSIETSHAAWVTLYTDTSSRTSDAGRARTTDPTPGSGVLAEVITTGARTQLITPGTICFNSAAAGTTYAKVVNDSGATNNITVTLTYVQLES